jgi:hypothetical protein
VHKLKKTLCFWNHMLLLQIMQLFALKCCSMELEMDTFYAGRCRSHKSEVVLFQELFSPFHQVTRSVGSCIDFYLLLNASKFSQNCFLPPCGFLLWNDWLTDYYYWCSCKSLMFFNLFFFVHFCFWTLHILCLVAATTNMRIESNCVFEHIWWDCSCDHLLQTLIWI